MVAWMDINKKENPLYEQFDRVCALMEKHDAVLSLGNGIRAGAIHDSHDRAQMAEMIINCNWMRLKATSCLKKGMEIFEKISPIRGRKCHSLKIV